jgi:mercuric ion transport protein
MGTAILPKSVCPACWPAYTGLLSSLGLGFINDTPYLLPVTAGFLMVVASLGYGAKARPGYTPPLLGLLAAVMMITGKCIVVSDWTVSGGLALLLKASLWNAGPRQSADSRACPVCIPAELTDPASYVR